MIKFFFDEFSLIFPLKCVVIYFVSEVQIFTRWFIFAEKTFDFSKVDFKKLKVNELKQILTDWGEQCRGCSEKADYIRLVEELLPKHVPEASRARGDL